MDSDDWIPARLIPLSGLRLAEEQEVRATSALLAVMTVVRDFGRALLDNVGAPRGQLQAFTEVSFAADDSRRLRPDGVIRITRGGRTWTALLEVKTGKNHLTPEQVEAYVTLANREGFDAVITISNEFVAPSAPHPVSVARRTLKRVELHHWSWTHILTTALILRQRHEIGDPEQSWILQELIRYLEDERSGALEFDGLGSHWVTVRDAARAGTLGPGDAGIDDVVNRWEQFLRYLCLYLGAQLGADVDFVVSRAHRHDPERRRADLTAALASAHVLSGTLRIPDAAGDVDFTADLRARRVSASLSIDAPARGRPRTRINWLIRQLRNAPADVNVTAVYGRDRVSSELLHTVREHVELLLDSSDSRREPRRFVVALERDMGAKGGRGRGSFVAVVEELARDFYHDVVQDLRAWVAPAPRIADGSELEDEGAPDSPNGEVGPSAPALPELVEDQVPAESFTPGPAEASRD